MRPTLSWLLAIGFVLGLALLWNNSSTGQAGANEINLRVAGGKSVSGRLAPAPVAATPACYTWDFLNNTGLDTTGLVIHLKGIPSITDVYTGVLNPFGAPDPSSGYNSNTNVYSLIFSGGTVPDSGMAQIGICASHPALRLDTAQPAFYWVVSGTPTSPGPLFAGLDFNWITPDHLQVHLYNEQSTPLTAFSFSALIPGSQLSLDDMNDAVASTLPLASDQITDPLQLAGGASTTFDIFFDQGNVQVPFGSPILLEATLSAQDDPGNLIHLFAQTSQPFVLDYFYFPLLKK
jgi:hypothetical protein